MTKSLEFICK